MYSIILKSLWLKIRLNSFLVKQTIKNHKKWRKIMNDNQIKFMQLFFLFSNNSCGVSVNSGSVISVIRSNFVKVLILNFLLWFYWFKKNRKTELEKFWKEFMHCSGKNWNFSAIKFAQATNFDKLLNFKKSQINRNAWKKWRLESKTFLMKIGDSNSKIIKFQIKTDQSFEH